jgi:hypothetical protein
MHFRIDVNKLDLALVACDKQSAGIGTEADRYDIVVNRNLTVSRQLATVVNSCRSEGADDT